MSRPDICGLRYFFLILALLVANINNSNAILLPLGNQIPAIFSFGDSNSDTGSCSAAFARFPYPNGITFFGNSSKRVCDGRLIIDFIAEKLSLPYLSAYLDAVEANFKHGANFAVSGTTIMPVNDELYGYGVTPLSLNIQLLQFQQFKQRVTELYNRDEILILLNRLPKPEDFSRALYTFDIGQNDLNVAGDQAYKSLPDLIDRFSLSIEQLHELGARNFLIFNTGPLGCLPHSLEMYPSKAKDEIGCLKSLNKMAQVFNQLLKAKISLLRTKLEDSSLVYADIYSAKYSLIRDAKLYAGPSLTFRGPVRDS
ncbi:GDSL esterase/lipase At3g26430-like isoform X2 [Silene latifolia]|uniref:GDSL esterase/lipase At3g26430-like isoform X2 n=1 Tax=Silene latifolia TaxID=37657 RepID=UPI003D77DE43